MGEGLEFGIGNGTKRICFFMDSISGKGGTERVASLIASGMVERGHQVLILSLYNGLIPEFALHEKIRLMELFPQKRQFKWKYFGITSRMREVLRDNGIEVLIATDIILTLYTLRASRRTGIVNIGWEHFNFLTNLNLKGRRLARYLSARMADAIVVLTNQDLALWKEHVRGRARILAIPNPVTFAPIKVNAGRWESKFAVAVGRFNHQKGFDLLISLWKEVAEKIPDWRLMIVGEGEDREALETQIARDGLTDYITLVPFSSRIEVYLNRASIFCLSSRFEGLPMVLLEAQAFALPSVCFDCYTGPAEVIINGVNGFLVNDNDLAGFAARIMQLANDERLRETMGLHALSRASDFQPQNILSRWEMLLNDLS